jgi:hypothetical protein
MRRRFHQLDPFAHAGMHDRAVGSRPDPIGWVRAGLAVPAGGPGPSGQKVGTHFCEAGPSVPSMKETMTVGSDRVMAVVGRLRAGGAANGDVVVGGRRGDAFFVEIDHR